MPYYVINYLNIEWQGQSFTMQGVDLVLLLHIFVIKINHKLRMVYYNFALCLSQVYIS
jgi:hypothetical protein